MKTGTKKIIWSAAVMMLMILLASLPLSASAAGSWSTVETMTAVFAFNKNDESRKQPYESSAKVKSYSSGAEVNVTASVKNDYGNVWYKLSDGSYVYSGDVDEQWRQTGTLNAYYKFRKDDEARKKPFESSAYVKGYFKGDIVKAVAKVKNNKGNTWLKLSTGNYVWDGDVELYYTVVKSGLNKYYWATATPAAAHKYPDDSSAQVTSYGKGTYMHIVEEVRNNRGVSGGNTWYKTDSGAFIYSGDIAFRYEPVSCEKGTYEAINYNGNAVELCKTPFTENKKGGILQVGTRVTVIGAVKNSAGNTWYEIKEASGGRKWVWSKCFKKVTVTKISSVNFANAAEAGLGFTYTGKAIKPAIVVKAGTTKLKKDTDYTVTYSNNVNAGKATITVKGKGNYTGTKSLTFKIEPVALKTAKTVNAALPYRGRKIEPALTVTAVVNGKTVKLVKNKDYTATYKNNINPGTASVTVKGKGNFTGTLTTTFKINKLKMSASSVNLSKTTMKYTGKALKPKVTVKAKVDGVERTLIEGTDYTVTYKNNVKVGTATVVITGKGNFTGTKSVTFTIRK